MLKIADYRRDIISHEFKAVQSMHERGILKPFVGKIFNYKNLPDAHAFMEDRKSIGKIVVTWD
jgi:NADPH2:quinone reductase